jgi:rhodanese-related sulfurtransferase
MPAEVPDVDVSRAITMLAGDGATLLDVREDDEWTAGHAAGAHHTRLGDLDTSAFTRSGTVVVTCRSGNRSRKAAAALVDAGVDAVNLEGGMKAWAAAGQPLVCDDGSTGTVA